MVIYIRNLKSRQHFTSYFNIIKTKDHHIIMKDHHIIMTDHIKIKDHHIITKDHILIKDHIIVKDHHIITKDHHIIMKDHIITKDHHIITKDHHIITKDQHKIMKDHKAVTACHTHQLSGMMVDWYLFNYGTLIMQFCISSRKKYFVCLIVIESHIQQYFSNISGSG